jgi:mono/diheme cytochrome c family protein
MDLCANCHGRTGDGLGISARHLFPAPRSFRDEPIRIVSTINGIASDQDLAKAIREGLGGVSMPAFPQLSDEQIEKLVAVVRRLQVDGLRNQYDRIMLEFEVESDDLDENGASESAADLWVKRRSTPSEPLKIPKFDDLSVSTTASGKAAFDRAGCKQCHTATSEGGNELLKFFDTLGRSVAIRNLVADRFRAGNSHEEIYKRVVLGMPGTPHPAISGLSEREIVDIVRYVRELSTESHENKKTLIPTTTNYQRRLQSQSNWRK